MPTTEFKFKKFSVLQTEECMKVSTDSVLLGAWVNVSAGDSVLDVGTGTGVLALILAQKNAAKIVGIDIQSTAIALAKENFERSIWSENLRAVQIPFQEFSETNFDLIISNPPYFSNALLSPKNNRNFTRHNQSLTFEEFIFSAKKAMSNKGKIALVLPTQEAKLFREIATQQQLFLSKIVSIQTKENKAISRVLMEFSQIYELPEENSILIHEKNGDYTLTYKTWTQDYYLNF